MKKKLLGFIFALMMVIVPVAILVGCGESEELDSINVTLTDTTMFQGQSFKSANPVVTATYKKGSKITRTENVTNYSISGYVSDKLGEQSITVKYEGKETEIEVNVLSASNYYEYILETATNFALYADQNFVIEQYGDDSYGSTLVEVEGNKIYSKLIDIGGLEHNSGEFWLIDKTVYNITGSEGYTKREYATERLAFGAMGMGNVTMYESYTQTMLENYKRGVIDFEISDVKIEAYNGKLVFTSGADSSFRLVVNAQSHLIEKFTRTMTISDSHPTLLLTFGNADIPELPDVEWDEVK